MKWMIIFVFIGVGVFLLKRGKNNVCKTFGDYYTDRDSNPNCYYNPDHELEVPDIVRRHGYPVETHYATTDDGYILSIHRIPHGLKNKGRSRKPVLLNHGITVNSGSFLLLGNRSLGFMLADAGYDVWLGNFRGTRYSRNHTTLDTKSVKFWNYSVHELGIYDVPAQIKLITDITSKPIIYLGYSLGSSAGYICSTTFPDLTKQKIEYFVALAPGMYLNHYLIPYLDFFWNLLLPIINYAANGMIYPRPPYPQFIFESVCFPFPFQMNICQILDMIILGFNYGENDPETLPVTLRHNIDTTTTKMLTHFSQIRNSGRFQQFDYGTEKNQLVYGGAVPPEYNLSKVSFGNYIVFSENDIMAPAEMIELLHERLPNRTYSKTVYKIENEWVNHIDILSGKNAHTLVYAPIIKELKRRGGEKWDLF